MRVLHVVESYGAGTASAVGQYVLATPDLEHHLIRRLRDDDDHADDGELARFASVTEMNPGVLSAVRSVRSCVKSLQPDVVHAHSSFGGAFARLAVRKRATRGRGALLVHTPHCYATERQDLGGPARRGYALAERLLGLNTDVVAACSGREAHLGARFAPRARHVVVPNVTEVTPGSQSRQPQQGPPVITAMGRLTAQRDPGVFRDLVGLLATRVEQPVRARWIGGGDPALVDALTRVGIEVTGWLPRSTALDLLSTSALYVHTARWDGAPMTMIEAHALGLPQVALLSPAIADAPAECLGADAEALADRVADLVADETRAKTNLTLWDGYFADCTPARQRVALQEAYGRNDEGRTS
ncbi:glycosyltransferase [Nocardioides sp.]|uniref:glycosyltransferase n=1 Tax=Nocardioides sp. TaxID=35761 RepID=UPI00356460ED